ncbi:Toluene efflux pump periplasmic linker protein TtgG [Planctomycetales bacterium 10988]|nr:Toluene efflux pump periplasmic linker protein TtgG [Planctomycetales bacterium 10988]
MSVVWLYVSYLLRKAAPIGLLMLGLLLTLGITGCQESKAAPESPVEAPAVEVSVAKPVRTPIVEWDEYTGRFDAIDSVEVRSRVSGYLQSIHFEEGEEVKEGNLLIIIDPRPFVAELNGANAREKEANARLKESQAMLEQAKAEKAQADAQVSLAERQLKRAEQLEARDAISEEEIDVRSTAVLDAKAQQENAKAMIASAEAGIATANAAIETAKSDVETAKLNLNYTQIRAPITGLISRRYVTPGNLISGGSNESTLLTTIVSMNPIHCYFDANEQAFLKYVRLSQQGKRQSSRDVKNPVYVSLIDEKGFPHKGHMDFVDNRIDPNTGTMRGRAILPNDDKVLVPGLFGKVRLPGSGRYEAVLIPDSSVGSDQSEKFVYTVNEKEEVERKTVALGPLVHGLRVIRDGLDGSEMLITRGLQRVFPGSKVTPIEESIEMETEEGLPDDYQPVPKEEWLNHSPDKIPEGVEANLPLYQSAPPSMTSESLMTEASSKSPPNANRSEPMQE